MADIISSLWVSRDRVSDCYSRLLFPVGERLENAADGAT